MYITIYNDNACDRQLKMKTKNIEIARGEAERQSATGSVTLGEDFASAGCEARARPGGRGRATGGGRSVRRY